MTPSYKIPSAVELAEIERQAHKMRSEALAAALSSLAASFVSLPRAVAGMFHGRGHA